MNQHQVVVDERQRVFDGYFKMDRYHLRHSLHSGGMSSGVVREVLERGQVAAVLPVDPLRRRLVLIEQFRPGAYARGWHPWLLECVAGIIEPGEHAEEVSRREAMEEAGCAITELIPIHEYLANPGACSESVSLYCGRVDSEHVGGIHGLAAEGEDIKVACYDYAAARALLDEGRIVNAITLIALQWFFMNREQVEQQWAKAPRPT